MILLCRVDVPGRWNSITVHNQSCRTQSEHFTMKKLVLDLRPCCIEWLLMFPGETALHVELRRVFLKYDDAFDQIQWLRSLRDTDTAVENPESWTSFALHVQANYTKELASLKLFSPLRDVDPVIVSQLGHWVARAIPCRQTVLALRSFLSDDAISHALNSCCLPTDAAAMVSFVLRGRQASDCFVVSMNALALLCKTQPALLQVVLLSEDPVLSCIPLELACLAGAEDRYGGKLLAIVTLALARLMTGEVMVRLLEVASQATGSVDRITTLESDSLAISASFAELVNSASRRPCVQLCLLYAVLSQTTYGPETMARPMSGVRELLLERVDIGDVAERSLAIDCLCLYLRHPTTLPGLADAIASSELCNSVVSVAIRYAAHPHTALASRAGDLLDELLKLASSGSVPARSGWQWRDVAHAILQAWPFARGRCGALERLLPYADVIELLAMRSGKSSFAIDIGPAPLLSQVIDCLGDCEVETEAARLLERMVVRLVAVGSFKDLRVSILTPLLTSLMDHPSSAVRTGIATAFPALIRPLARSRKTIDLAGDSVTAAKNVVTGILLDPRIIASVNATAVLVSASRGAGLLSELPGEITERLMAGLLDVTESTRVHCLEALLSGTPAFEHLLVVQSFLAVALPCSSESQLDRCVACLTKFLKPVLVEARRNPKPRDPLADPLAESSLAGVGPGIVQVVFSTCKDWLLSRPWANPVAIDSAAALLLTLLEHRVPVSEVDMARLAAAIIDQVTSESGDLASLAPKVVPVLKLLQLHLSPSQWRDALGPDMVVRVLRCLAGRRGGAAVCLLSLLPSIGLAVATEQFRNQLPGWCAGIRDGPGHVLVIHGTLRWLAQLVLDEPLPSLDAARSLIGLTLGVVLCGLAAVSRIASTSPLVKPVEELPLSVSIAEAARAVEQLVLASGNANATVGMDWLDGEEEHADAAWPDLHDNRMESAWLAVKEACSLSSLIVTSTMQRLVWGEGEIAALGLCYCTIALRSNHLGILNEACQSLSALSSLLHHPSLAPEYKAMARLPVEVWLPRLLKEVEVRREFSRQSGGIAAALVAIATACPDGTLAALLSNCMDRFTDFNSDSTSSSPIPVVHCLNVMVRAARHSPLSYPFDGSLGRAMGLALQGFDSPHYGIKNASQLLFSCLLHRYMGGRRPGDQSAVTTSEFFSHVPELKSTLLAILRSPAWPVRSQTVRDSLVPALLLLGKLRGPPLDQARPEDVLLLKDLVSQLVYLCKSVSSRSARGLAAKAIANLLPPEQLETLVCEVLSALPQSSTHNCLSGSLVLLRNLVQRLDLAMTTATRAAVITVLTGLDWVLSPLAMPCPSIAIDFACVLAAVFMDPECDIVQQVDDGCEEIVYFSRPGQILDEAHRAWLGAVTSAAWRYALDETSNSIARPALARLSIGLAEVLGQDSTTAVLAALQPAVDFDVRRSVLALLPSLKAGLADVTAVRAWLWGSLELSSRGPVRDQYWLRLLAWALQHLPEEPAEAARPWELIEELLHMSLRCGCSGLTASLLRLAAKPGSIVFASRHWPELVAVCEQCFDSDNQAVRGEAAWLLLRCGILARPSVIGLVGQAAWKMLLELLQHPDEGTQAVVCTVIAHAIAEGGMAHAVVPLESRRRALAFMA